MARRAGWAHGGGAERMLGAAEVCASSSIGLASFASERVGAAIIAAGSHRETAEDAPGYPQNPEDSCVVLTLPILMYHKVRAIPSAPGYLRNYVSPEQFEQQMAAILHWGYTPITLEQWLEIRAGRQQSPNGPSRSLSMMAIAPSTKMPGRCSAATGSPQRSFWSPIASGARIAGILRDHKSRYSSRTNRRDESSRVHFGSHTCTHGR